MSTLWPDFDERLRSYFHHHSCAWPLAAKPARGGICDISADVLGKGDLFLGCSVRHAALRGLVSYANWRKLKAWT